jgi:hypothetical protein
VSATTLEIEWMEMWVYVQLHMAVLLLRPQGSPIQQWHPNMCEGTKSERTAGACASVVQITNAVAGVWKFHCDVVALAVVRNRSCRIVGSHLRGGYTLHDTLTFDYKRERKVQRKK